MQNITVNFGHPTGRIKPMNAVNNGPVRDRPDARENFISYANAGFPYARTHDAAYGEEYGGDHIVDVHNIFPDFAKDPPAPDSYDFVMTDKYFRDISDAGTRVFNRLGTKIEHSIKKYGSLPPKNFKKWAVVCEQIIRHYTEGWADGLHLDIEYWEIWNEPDGYGGCWGGTMEEFFRFYHIAATHLKTEFPHLKIGGPALAGNMEWAEAFLAQLQAPLDFFSWHIYTTAPEIITQRAAEVRRMLDKYGYANTESILNEWNYVSGWKEGFLESLETIGSIKGAAFDAACMLAGQHSSIDMMMYYDARPMIWNGLFDYYTLRPKWGYYAFTMFGTLYKMEQAVECTADGENLYAAAACDGNGRRGLMIAYYTDEENAPEKTVCIHGYDGMAELYLLDQSHSGSSVGTICPAETPVALRPNTVILLRT